MGNQPSSDSSSQRNPPNAVARLLRQSNALGLSKVDLDQRCRPSGLYPSCHWEEKVIRRLIGDGRIAARLVGCEKRAAATDQECPICFLHYPEINTTQCCQAVLCTECYLQVKPQRDNKSSCPFCNDHKLQVRVANTLKAEEVLAREREETLAKQARERDHSFGKNLEKRLSSRKRSESVTSSRSGCGDDAATEKVDREEVVPSTPVVGKGHESDNELPLMQTMTPDERRALEAEMQEQNKHPLAQQMEQEEMERRERNEIDYYRNRQQQQPRRDWNRIVDAFESGGHGGRQVQSLDDLVVLEAAIMLSMQEEEGRRNGGSATNNNSSSSNVSTEDAARHARSGFPLARQRVQDAGFHSLMRNFRAAGVGGNGGNARMSEEEQVAMAIAASLADQQQQTDDNNDNNNAATRNDGVSDNV